LCGYTKRMSKYFEIEDTNNPGSYYTVRDGTCEYVNPIYNSYLAFSDMRLRIRIVLLKNKFGTITPNQISKLKNEISDEWQEHKKNVLNHELPKEWLELFNLNKKKAQQKNLANTSLSIEDFEAFIFHSWERFGFKFSKYVFDHDPIEYDNKQKPTIIFKKDENDIRTVGDTELSTGQLKSIIDKRNVIVANLFDKDDEWHCLFLTYKGIAGQELDHPPHMHYVSSAFGFSRDELINNFKQRKYSLDSIHVPFTGYNPVAEASLIKDADF
jgi:hypothetical protein